MQMMCLKQGDLFWILKKRDAVSSRWQLVSKPSHLKQAIKGIYIAYIICDYFTFTFQLWKISAILQGFHILAMLQSKALHNSMIAVINVSSFDTNGVQPY